MAKPDFIAKHNDRGPVLAPSSSASALVVYASRKKGALDDDPVMSAKKIISPLNSPAKTTIAVKATSAPAKKIALAARREKRIASCALIAEQSEVDIADDFAKLAWRTVRPNVRAEPAAEAGAACRRKDNGSDGLEPASSACRSGSARARG